LNNLYIYYVYLYKVYLQQTSVMFTTTTIKIPGNSVTFYQREGTTPSSGMKNAIKTHTLLALPSEGGGIPRELS
jgi:hypothetical protein